MNRRELEQVAAREASRLCAGPLKGLHFTLLVFDFGDTGNVAFSSTLPAPDRLEAFGNLITRWTTGELVFEPLPIGMTLADVSAENVQRIGDAVERAIGPAMGYALLIGTGRAINYVAHGDRPGVRAMLEDELMPGWMEEANDTASD